MQIRGITSDQGTRVRAAPLLSSIHRMGAEEQQQRANGGDRIGGSTPTPISESQFMIWKRRKVRPSFLPHLQGSGSPFASRSIEIPVFMDQWGFKARLSSSRVPIFGLRFRSALAGLYIFIFKSDLGSTGRKLGLVTALCFGTGKSNPIISSEVSYSGDRDGFLWLFHCSWSSNSFC